MAKIASKTVGENDVRFAFVDGEALTCDLDSLPDHIVKRLALHGLSQKVGDSYASAESVHEAQVAARGVWDNLRGGVWAVKASRGGKMVEALARATGKPVDECLAAYQAMDKNAVAALRKHPDIKRALAEIDLERAKAQASAPTDADAPDLSNLF